MPDFWERCVAAECVVIPVRLYSDYTDGNLDEAKFQGIRFAALSFSNEAVGPDYWFMIDESQSGLENLYATPEEALEAHKGKIARRREANAI